MPAKSRLSFAIAILICSDGVCRAQTPGESELLDFVRAAHQSSRSLIKTSYCRVRFESTGLIGKPPAPKTHICESEYWHSVDAIRLRIAENDQVIESVWKDGIRNSITYKGLNGSTVGAERSAYPTRYLHRADAWVRGLLVVNKPGTGRSITFEQLLREATRVKSVERVEISGKSEVIVKLYFERPAGLDESMEVEIHFDPAVNYLIRKAVHYWVGRTARKMEEVVQFKDCGNGIYFPEKITGGYGVDEKLEQSQSVAVLSGISVNQLIPAERFTLKYPNKIYLTDSIRNTSYRVNVEGQPVSAERELGRYPPPPVAKRAENPPPTETETEPQSATRWILPVSVSLIVVAAVLFMVRKRRVKTES